MLEFIIIAGGLYGLYLVGIALYTDIKYRKSRTQSFPRTRRSDELEFLFELIDYVNEFYGAGGLYQLPIENNDVGSLVNVKTRHVTRAEISHAIMIYFSILEYQEHKRYAYTYGGNDSIDRKGSGIYYVTYCFLKKITTFTLIHAPSWITIMDQEKILPGG